MASIISGTNTEEHRIDKYNFKVIDSKGNSNTKESSPEKVFTEEDHPKARSSDIDSSALSTSSKESLIESLMQKN